MGHAFAGLKLATDVPFLTPPELLARMSEGVKPNAMQQWLVANVMARSILHLRDEF